MNARQKFTLYLTTGLAAITIASTSAFAQQQKAPNVVMLMTDDTGWSDFGCLYRRRQGVRTHLWHF